MMDGPWEQYRGSADQPWNVRRVVHLHRCAGFAATWGEIQRDLHDGPDDAVGRLLRGEARLDGLRGDFEQTASRLAEAAVISGDIERLKAWWIFRFLFCPDPLVERLTLMWHNHFATSNLKVRDPSVMRKQNQTFRTFARAPFAKLLFEMLRDPALLVWLDAPSNRKGQPNENLARELMELFTLGVGNFTEADVKDAARALTGLSVVDGEFRFLPQWHDEGEKTIVGKTGRFDADDLARVLVEHPATSRRLAWRICRTFLGEGSADDAAIDELAKGLRERNLDVGWAVETVLRSNLFFSNANIGTRVCGPIEFVIGAARAMQMFDPPPSTLVLAEWCRRLGQDLFHPPNVGGWAEGRSWLSTRTIVARANFGAALVRGELTSSGAAPDLLAIAHTPDVNQAIRFFNELILGGSMNSARLDELARSSGTGPDQLAITVSLIFASPEAQLM
jgi:uncharacterized protein (DUF1800 family)